MQQQWGVDSLGSSQLPGPGSEAEARRGQSHHNPPEQGSWVLMAKSSP